MESLFYRYRNITVLLVVIIAQIVLLAWQVRNDTDVPMVRVWAVTAVTPVASAIENTRNVTTGFFSNYFELRNAREQSRRLHTEVDRLTLENQLLKNELGSAQRAEQLAGFQAHMPSKMLGARVIGATPGANTKSILIDRGATAGIRRGMAVVTPDGIIGRVIAVFPFASQVLSVTDPGFAAGVESQKNHVHGVMKGLGNSVARVDYVAGGQKVEQGEMFYTSGEDRIFPRGLPAGKVSSVRDGGSFQEIIVEPSGAQTAPEEVLVILDPVHQAIPDAPAEDTPVFLAPAPPPDSSAAATGSAAKPNTPADKLMDQYRKIGDAQKHVFGIGEPGTLPPNFNLKVPGVNAPAVPASATGATGPVSPAPVKPATTGATGPVSPAPVKPATTGATGPVSSTPVKPAPAAATQPAPVRPVPAAPVKPVPVPPTAAPAGTTSAPVRPVPPGREPATAPNPQL